MRFKQTKKEIVKCLPILIFFVVLSLSFSVVSGYFSATIFAQLIDSIGVKSSKLILYSLLSYAVVLIISNIVPICCNMLFRYTRNRINNATQSDIMNMCSRDMLVSFEDDKWLPQYERVCSLNAVFSDFIYTSTVFLTQIVLLLSYFAYLYEHIEKQAYLYILIIVPALLKSSIFSVYYTRLKRQMTPQLQLERKYHETLINPVSQSEARLFHSGMFLYNKWRKQYDENFKKYLNSDKKFILVNFLCNTAITVIAIATGINLFSHMQKGVLSVGITVAVIPFIGKIISSSDVTTQNFGSFILTFREYREIIQLFKDVNEKSGKESLQEKKEIDIRVSNLSFHYPSSDRLILENVNMEIKSGQKIAIVGVNGAGKSTLMKLLAGYYKPTSGEVYYSSQNVQNIKDEDLKETLSFVYQQPVRYPATFKENILSKNKDVNDKFVKILNEIDSNFLDLFSQDYILTPGFSNSRDVSGGQWQKISFLRSIQKESRIYFFDEPTASLDPMSEVKLFELFNQHIKNKTIILATHRLGLARQADQIIVLDKKRVVGIGSHEHLLKRCSIYKELYDLQAMWYNESTINEC